MAGGLPGYPPKPPFPSTSLVADPARSAPPAWAALSLIAGTRIGGGVDVPVRLAVGVTLGRATTTPRSSGSSARIPSAFGEDRTPTHMP
jgi:hypothetical protein